MYSSNNYSLPVFYTIVNVLGPIAIETSAFARILITLNKWNAWILFPLANSPINTSVYVYININYPSTNLLPNTLTGVNVPVYPIVANKV